MNYYGIFWRPGLYLVIGVRCVYWKLGSWLTVKDLSSGSQPVLFAGRCKVGSHTMQTPFYILPEESTFYCYQKEDIRLDRIAVLDEEHCESAYVKTEKTVCDSDIVWTVLKGSFGFLGEDVGPPCTATSFPLQVLCIVTWELAKVTEASPVKMMKDQDNSLAHALTEWGLWAKRSGLPTHSLFYFMASSMEHETQKQMISEESNWAEHLCRINYKTFLNSCCLLVGITC